jgi:hypothetical protein
MKKLLSMKVAGNTLIVTLALLIILHILIVTGILPYEFVWGGQIADEKSIMVFELIALVLYTHYGLIL